MNEIALPSPEFTSASTFERVSAAAGLAAIGGASAAVAYFDPSKAGFFPVCPLYAMTGIACPGCGLTRGFHAILHGDILTAFDYNALFPMWILFIGFFVVSLVFVVVRGRGLSMKLLKPGLLWAFFILLFVFGILRNLPFYPFSVLYP
jgi:hypothetical protein